MSKKSDKNLIVGLDIGTSKVVVIVGEIVEETINIIGMGSHPSVGLRKGVVVNIEATTKSIYMAIEEAELMAGCQIYSVYTGIAGNHIKSLNSHGIVAIHDNEVTQADVDRVIEAAKAVAIPANQKILHILPQQFIIDAQEGVREPIGMSGVRLEAEVHMVTGSVSAAQNIIKCVRSVPNHHLEVDDVILEQLASSYAVLTEDEKELGVCLIDIGGGTTDIAVFKQGAIRHTAVIPVAGDQVTNDIAVALRIPTQNAETIKKEYGSALTRLVDPQQYFEVIGGFNDRSARQIDCATLAEVIEPRYEELFLLVQAELRRHRLEECLGSGIVVTGGSSLMRGAIELAEDIFEMPVRLGSPRHVNGLEEIINNPIYATGVGLLLYGHNQQAERGPALSMSQSFPNVWMKMKRWFQGNF